MDDPWATIREVAADRRSGAAQIAERAAGALAVISSDEARSAIEILVKAHPSMAPLWRLGSEVLSGPDPASGAARFTRSLARDADASRLAATLLPDEVATISFSSSVAEAIRLRTPARVFCMRSLPGGEGARMARLLSGWTRAEVVEDDDALTHVPGAAILTGADAVTPTGVINKVKSRALAEAARRAGLPCYAVAGETKFVDRRLPVRAPFEEIPLGLFTALAGPMGPLTPEAAAGHAARARLDTGLAQFVEGLDGP